MNREIKFRGKSTYNGNFVYGDLIKHNCDYFIIPFFGISCTSEQHNKTCDTLIYLQGHKIHSNSIGQYTGLRDSTTWEELSKEEQDQFLKIGVNAESDWKGREIYEGDILDITYSDKQGECHHTENYVLNDLRNTSVIGWLDYANELKVVGNIFENPEFTQE